MEPEYNILEKAGYSVNTMFSYAEKVVKNLHRKICWSTLNKKDHIHVIYVNEFEQNDGEIAVPENRRACTVLSKEETLGLKQVLDSIDCITSGKAEDISKILEEDGYTDVSTSPTRRTFERKGFYEDKAGTNKQGESFIRYFHVDENAVYSTIFEPNSNSEYAGILMEHEIYMAAKIFEEKK